MGIKKYKPTSPGRRQMTVSDFSELTRREPEKSLTEGKRSTGGRNNMGRVTVRFRGGGVRRRYRIIDFRRVKDECSATVREIEYDPNRSARIALLEYEDGVKSYIICPVGLNVGDVVRSGEKADFKPGHVHCLKDIPDGLNVHCIELYPGQGACIARAAGQTAIVRAKEGNYVQVKMPSGEVRLIPMNAKATIGQVGNLDFQNIQIGKAGRKRHMGIRPTVRGSVMNPVDHPHGGGEGRSPIGRPGPVTPWGKPALGYKTRDKKARTNKMIVKRRNNK